MDIFWNYTLKILSHGTKKRSKTTKKVNKNQLPFFFLCAKYGPKVKTISRE